MGYIRHHSITVTSFDNNLIADAHNVAIGIFDGLVTDVIESNTNGYKSFFIAPDGSKEGWAESSEGDRNRSKFIKWVNEQAYEDGSNALSYCEFFYGDDERMSQIEDYN